MPVGTFVFVLLVAPRDGVTRAGDPRLVIGDPRIVGTFVFDLFAAQRDGVIRSMCPEASYK